MVIETAFPYEQMPDHRIQLIIILIGFFLLGFSIYVYIKGTKKKGLIN